MTNENQTSDAKARLLDSIADILIRNGIKATSMDSIASTLHISKRTLYEIFGSKAEMVTQALSALHLRMRMEHTHIFESTENVLEAILLSFLKQRDIMSKLNVDFFSDMDSLFAEAKMHSKESKQEFIDNIVAMLRKGVEQGYFRDDVNLNVQCRMMLIQMESLKRMEELFPPDITLLDAYDTVSIGFLRSMASIKGMEMLDQLTRKLYDKP